MTPLVPNDMEAATCLSSIIKATHTRLRQGHSRRLLRRQIRVERFIQGGVRSPRVTVLRRGAWPRRDRDARCRKFLPNLDTLRIHPHALHVVGRRRTRSHPCCASAEIHLRVSHLRTRLAERTNEKRASLQADSLAQVVSKGKRLGQVSNWKPPLGERSRSGQSMAWRSMRASRLDSEKRRAARETHARARAHTPRDPSPSRRWHRRHTSARARARADRSEKDTHSGGGQETTRRGSCGVGEGHRRALREIRVAIPRCIFSAARRDSSSK